MRSSSYLWYAFPDADLKEPLERDRNLVVGRRWPLAEFKANLQAYFLIINTFLIVNHAIAGNLTEEVWHSSLVALPVAMLGLFAGFTMDRYLSGPRFRRLVPVLLMVMSLLLIFS